MEISVKKHLYIAQPWAIYLCGGCFLYKNRGGYFEITIRAQKYLHHNVMSSQYRRWVREIYS